MQLHAVLPNKRQPQGIIFLPSLLVTTNFLLGHFATTENKTCFQFSLLLLQSSSGAVSMVVLLDTKTESGLCTYLFLERHLGHNSLLTLLANSTQNFWKMQGDKCLEIGQESNKANVNMKS